MAFERDLYEAQNYLKSNKVIERRKALERFTVLINNQTVIEAFNNGEPFSWKDILQDAQSCLRKECERVADTIQKSLDKNLDLSMEFLMLVIQTALNQGDDTIQLPLLIRYIEGCLQEKKMRIRKDYFLKILKDHILPNPNRLGCLDQEDFILLFNLLKSELNKCSMSEASSLLIYNCFSLLIAHGPLSGFPPNYLREQVDFISELCQKVTQNDARVKQEDAIEIVLDFCKHTVEDNRLSCAKLGEEVLTILLSLYSCSAHGSKFKVKTIEFCLLQMVIHHPGGAKEHSPQALAAKWSNWKMCLRKIYILITKEVEDYLKLSVKNTQYFIPQGPSSSIILESFVELFVEVYQQILDDNGIFSSGASPEDFNMTAQSHKRQRIMPSLDSLISEIQISKCWVWIRLVSALLKRYPALIVKAQFDKLLQILHNLQLKVTDENTINHIYEAEVVLVDLQFQQSISDDRQIAIWKLISQSTLRAVGLNQNIRQTQALLRKFIVYDIVNLESLIQTYTSGVLNITEHHLFTLELVLESINFSQFDKRLREHLINALLNSTTIKDFDCLLKKNFANVLVALVLKQCPKFEAEDTDKTTGKYASLIELYSKSDFECKTLMNEKSSATHDDVKRIYNVDLQMVDFLLQKLEVFAGKSVQEPANKLLCIFGLLYNVLGNMVNFQVVQLSEIPESEVLNLMKVLLMNPQVASLERFNDHSSKRLKEIMKIMDVLDEIFSIKCVVTDIVKELFSLQFFQEIRNILNFFNDVTRSKAEMEHQLKVKIVKALAKFCLVSNNPIPNSCQNDIIQMLSGPDYDFTNETDYDLSVTFLRHIHLADSGYFSNEAIENIINCIKQICFFRYRNYHYVLDALTVLADVYSHFAEDQVETYSSVELLQPLYVRRNHYGPRVSLTILCGIERLCKVDPNFRYARWEGKELIRYVPPFLSSDFQAVRYRAIEVLTDFIRTTSGSTQIETLHLVEELFDMIYESNLAVFELVGNLTPERHQDEIIFRASSCLQTFFSIIVNCHCWIEESLFAVLRIEQKRKLINIANGEVLDKMFKALATHFASKDFMKKHIEGLISKWIVGMSYSIDDFPYKIIGCLDKLDLYVKYLDYCVPLLIGVDKHDLLQAGQLLKLTENDVLERCCTKIFVRSAISDIGNVNNAFLETNPNVVYLRRQLGDKFRENLMENIGELLIGLISSVTEEKAVREVLGEDVLFTSRGISCEGFRSLLEFIEKFICDGRNVVDFLADGRLDKIQQVLLALKLQIFDSIAEQRLQRFYQYTIFVEMLLKNLKNDSPFAIFFLKDTIHFLVHSMDDPALTRPVLTYTTSFVRTILPTWSEEFEESLSCVVDSLKNIATENVELTPNSLTLLRILVIDNSYCLSRALQKLDGFPLAPQFVSIRNAHDTMRYGDKKLTLEDEIRFFLGCGGESSTATARHDSLAHLRAVLSREKEQLKSLYDRLSATRGFLEDCEQSLVHKLTSKLIKISRGTSDDSLVSVEAIKCLGELGPANLTTMILEPEKRTVDQARSPLERLIGCAVSLLSQFLLDRDLDVVRTASATLYEMLKYSEGKKVVGSRIDYGYGPISKEFLGPFLSRCPTRSSQIKLNAKNLSEFADNAGIWCPSETTTYAEWIKSLVVALLRSVDSECYLQALKPVCEISVVFSETILPLIVHWTLSLNNQTATTILSRRINDFFEAHWKCPDKSSISSNTKAVKCMLDIVNFIRQQPSFLQKFDSLQLNYLYISGAAAFCSAHFSALLYAELWCQEKIAIFQADSLNRASVESDFTLLDFIYENVEEEIGNTLYRILHSAYKSIGDLEALAGCGLSPLLRPNGLIEYFKSIGKKERVMDYYCMQPLNDNLSDRTNLIESFKMNELYQLPLLCSDASAESQYECLWRLGQWNVDKKDGERFDKISSSSERRHYQKYKFLALKALCDNDRYTYEMSSQTMRACLIDDLKDTSLESSKNVYPILTELQCLVEMDDWLSGLNNRTPEEILSKWKRQDSIVRSNDFQFVEPICAQRMTILGEYIKKQSGLPLDMAYFDVFLDFAEYAKEELHIRSANSAIINLRKTSVMNNVSINNELQFREAQLAWLNGDKMIAMHLLRILGKNPDLTPRLKAHCLNLQGVYMAETHSDRTSVLNTFSESIKTFTDMRNNLTRDDRKTMEDTYDKIASFADREYQQIMCHIQSDLFQQKLSNFKSCQDAAKKLDPKKAKSKDEARACQYHQQQVKIDDNEINATQKDKNVVLELALRFYIKNLATNDSNNIKIFRIIALFLDNRDNKSLTKYLEQMIEQIPSYKYVTILPQLVPHISASEHDDSFGQKINRIIERCSEEHPHHTLPLLLALVNAYKDRQYGNSKEKTRPANERSEAADRILKRLSRRETLKGLIDRMQLVAEALIELAYYTDSSSLNSKKSDFGIPGKLKITKIRNFDDVLVPTYTLPISKSGKYDDIVGITKFNTSYQTVGGINAPKRIECVCSRGNTYSQLVKGQDDLRQDAVMQQVFKIMTDLLSANKQTKNLKIRTYKIVPLSIRSGVLEWVANSVPIGDYLVGKDGAHTKFRPKDYDPLRCRKLFMNSSDKTTAEKLKVYNTICNNFRPVFHKFFETSFRQPSVWYERRRAYIHSVATTSMCGYILGIGDRHISNILIDKQTAEVIHIDFGIAFEQGKCLNTPETVPFRLTRDIVDGMGVSGIEGLFRKSCERTMEVLRANSQTILTILEVLLYDPLYFWTVSAAEAKKRQTDEDIEGTVVDEREDENKNISAERALLRLKSKLQGTEDGKPATVEQQVGTLLKQAIDPVNLCRLFHGWQPYV